MTKKKTTTENRTKRVRTRKKVSSYTPVLKKTRKKSTKKKVAKKKVVKRQRKDKTPKVQVLDQTENANFQVVKYNYSSADRINDIPSFSKTLNENFLENLMAKYSLMTVTQLEMASEDPDVSILERIIMEQLAVALDQREKLGADAAKYIQERIGGKAKQVIEHSGPKGSAIKLTHETITKQIDNFLDLLDENELEEYEQMALNKAEFEDKIRKKVNGRPQ